MKRLLSRPAVVAACTVAGVGLFLVTLHAVDASAVLAGVLRMGKGFALIVLLSGLRLAMRAGAWTACAGGPSRLPVGTAFAACVAGEAAGSLTPLGLAASEPAKVLWTRGRLGTIESAAALAVETLLYSLAVAVMLAAGTLVWAAAFAPPLVTAALAAGLLAALGTAAWVARARHRSGARAVLRWLDARGQHHPPMRAVAEGLRRSAEVLRDLVTRQPGTLAVASLLQLLFHATSVAEVWLMLVLLGVPGATVLNAFLLDFANRAVTVAFKFVPVRLGVDEVASGGMAAIVGTGSAVGVTLAIVRKARVLVWGAVGLVLAAGRALARRERPRDATILVEPADPAVS